MKAIQPYTTVVYENRKTGERSEMKFVGTNKRDAKLIAAIFRPKGYKTVKIYMTWSEEKL